ncbi:MAG TPA: hypothetical protein VEM13_11365 [Gemmatimonadales bacterium]|nr:hypothetical protein [Gemmatimonadales bacterium]
MMRTASRAAPVLVLAAVAWGCHRPAAAPLNPQAEVAVTVDNQNYLDMDVFLIRGGQRIRIGMVPGISSRMLMLRSELIGYGTEVQFELHPIGGRGNTISETVTVRPGDVIQLTIPPN